MAAGIAASAAALVLVLIVAALFPLPRRQEEERESTLPALRVRWALPLAAAVLALVFGAFVAVVEFGAGRHGAMPAVPGVHGALGPGGIRHIAGAQEGGGSSLQLMPAAIAAAALLGLVGLAAAVAIARRPRPGPEHDRAPVAAELESAIARSLQDLRIGGDARLSVIRCYVRMERALASAGVRRGSTEAPREYLARVQAELGGTEAARRLTALFEEARFSAHRIGEPMRAAALEALEQLRAELNARRKAPT